MNLSKFEQGNLFYKSVLFDDDVKPSSDDGSLRKMSVDLDVEPADTTLTETNLSHDDDITPFEEPIENTIDAEVQDETIDTPK